MRVSYCSFVWLTNFGQPYITVRDGDYNGQRELYLMHHHDGRDLDQPYAERTLGHIHYLWRRPVHLEALIDGHLMLFTCSGDETLKRELS